MESAGWITFSRRHVCLLALFAFAVNTRIAADDLPARDYAVEITANIASAPPEITLSWNGDQYARSYTIRRKSLDAQAWQEVAVGQGPATGFTDRDVQRGIGYEYQVVKESSLGIQGYGYIYSGIDLPLQENRGILILLVEASLAEPLKTELLRFEYDLIGDGWSVERAVVPQTDSPQSVRALVQGIVAKNPAQTRALFLFGHIPVPYSGNINPDGHENHLGAWPADVYYADIDGNWTDTEVNSTSGEQARQWNVPGDGKLDQSEPPSRIELQTGRVDLSNLTCFENKTPSRSELDLARQYLDKNHRFRSGAFPVEQRAIIFDRIESKTAEPVAAMAWRNFAPLVGGNVAAISDLEYFPKVSSGTYLWSGVTAGGSYIASDRVGTSDAFALNDVNVVFTTFLGSYYGDWDVESSFLRASLGARGTILCTVYSGQPQWLFHPMGLGETIGYSARITQENGVNGLYPPHNNGAGEVHVALLGDPTLRAYPVPEVRNLRGEQGADGLIIGWQVPVIGGLAGFHVYRAPSSKGPYTRLTQDPVSQSVYRVGSFQPGESLMVKAVALTRSPSGSFYNSSVGVFYPDPTAQAGNSPPDAPTGLSVATLGNAAITLTWVGATATTSGFRLERRDPGASSFHEIASTGGDTFSFVDNALAGPGSYTYRVRAFNAAGSSPYSNETIASTLLGTAEFAGLDRATQGGWIGTYGGEGFIIPGWQEQVPPYLSLTTSNVVLFETGPQEDPRGPQLTNSPSRSANCWVNGTPLAFHLNFTDDAVHQVALYTAAWGRRQPLFDVEMLDAVSGASLDRRVFEKIDEGVYAIYNVRRQIYVRITPPSIFTNSEIYGIFFDRARLTPVEITPASGTFAGKTQVTLRNSTPNAEIHYTLDGSEPTAGSTRYDGPFWIRSSLQVRARAFREGFEPSPEASALYQNSVASLAGLISWDDETAGDWSSRYGTEGSWLPMGTPFLPAWCNLGLDGGTDWTWSDDTVETRAPLAARSGTLRQARAWYALDAMTIDLGILDTRMHAVSLYFVDYDGGDRSEEVEILDDKKEVKEHFTIRDFQQGRYLTLGILGEVQLRIRRTAGPNAVLSGIFIDAAPPPLSLVKAVPLTGLSVINGRLNFAVAGFPGLKVCTDRSSNLIDWECFSTNSLVGSTAQLGVTMDSFEPKQFFRVHFVP